jgi:flagellar hook-associated protein 3 FlgL
MRVSTQQFYFQSSKQITDKQSDVNMQSNYLATGKRVLSAKDDAINYGTLTGYKEQLAGIEKYKRNITQANNRNSLQESSLANVESILQHFKTLFIQANNGALSDSDVAALKNLAQQDLEQIVDIANSKDETGGYIFAGFKTDQQPFNIQFDNTVNYQGDSGVRQLQISQNVIVDTNQPGDRVFNKAPNHLGDFKANYNTNTSGIKVEKAIIANRGTYNAVANPPDYNFSFSSATNLTVKDSAGATVYSTAAYTPGQLISFNGLEIQLRGKPLPGDDIDLTPQNNVSVFESLKMAVDWMGAGANPANAQQHSVDYNHTIAQLNISLDYINSRRSEAGVRQQLIENQENNHEDTALYINQARSNIEDLDFAKAVSQFEQAKIALQAAQQAFIQVKDLSLLNFL